MRAKSNASQSGNPRSDGSQSINFQEFEELLGTMRRLAPLVGKRMEEEEEEE